MTQPTASEEPRRCKKRWTLPDLRALRAYARRGDSLELCAQACQHSVEDCDLALWTMVGRSFAETMQELNPAPPAAAPRPVKPAPSPDTAPVIAESVAPSRVLQLFIPPPPPITMRDIATRVAAAHGFTLDKLKSSARTKALCAARFEAMHEMRQATWQDGRQRFSMPQIGAFLGGRDHTTVLHGLRAYERSVGQKALAAAE